MSSNSPEEFRLLIEKKIDIDAPPAVVFASVLEQIGPGSDLPDGTPMPMVLEAWPGGRWFRDLGQNAGHFWGQVQVIKPPKLLELVGPMFMSYPVMSHLQYRLTEAGGGTQLSMTHRLIGDMPAEHRAGIGHGWEHILKRIGERSI